MSDANDFPMYTAMGTSKATAIIRKKLVQEHDETSVSPMLSSSSVSSATSSSDGLEIRLNSCDLLVSVLECYMTQLISPPVKQDSQWIPGNNSHRASAEEHHDDDDPSIFHALELPCITPVEYLRRLARYCYCSRSVFIIAFFYLKKIQSLTSFNLSINSLSIHRLLLTTVLLATKATDDILYDNAHFAKVGGLGVAELNTLELEMLKILDFRLHVTKEQFEQFEHHLLYTIFTTKNPDFVMLPVRLKNLGYIHQHEVNNGYPLKSKASCDYRARSESCNQTVSNSLTSKSKRRGTAPRKFVRRSPTCSMDISFASPQP